MAGLPPSLILPASAAAIRLPPPAGSAPGHGSEGRPVSAVFPPPQLREDTQARQPRQNLAEGRGGRTRGTDHTPFGRSRPRTSDSEAQSFSATGIVSSSFLAQVLGQDLGPAGNIVALHRDGPALGSDAYRRAGGEPAIYSEEPRLLRLAV